MPKTIDLKEAAVEIEQARGFNEAQAAFMSFVRRNVKTFRAMTPAERKDMLKQLGLNPDSHYGVVAKEIAVFNYDHRRKLGK